MKFFTLFTIGTLFVGMGLVHEGEIVNEESAYSSEVTTPQLFEGVIAGKLFSLLSIKINGNNTYAYRELLGCEGDLDDDGIVGLSDLIEFLSQWGTDGPADFDGDGIVDVYDLLILLYDWGSCD